MPPLERRTPWRVAAYTPSSAGLVVRLAIAGCTLVFGAVAALGYLRPGIDRDDAMRLAQSTLGSDPLLARTLGTPIELQLGEIAPRRALRGGAIFALEAHGPLAHQSMTVVARHSDAGWAIEEIFDIQTTAADSTATRVARGGGSGR